jgi:hypothetical protein
LIEEEQRSLCSALLADVGHDLGKRFLEGGPPDENIPTDPRAVPALAKHVIKEVDVMTLFVDEEKIDPQIEPLGASGSQRLVDGLDGLQKA